MFFYALIISLAVKNSDHYLAEPDIICDKNNFHTYLKILTASVKRFDNIINQFDINYLDATDVQREVYKTVFDKAFSERNVINLVSTTFGINIIIYSFSPTLHKTVFMHSDRSDTVRLLLRGNHYVALITEEERQYSTFDLNKDYIVTPNYIPYIYY